jgi:hypothetical protein
VKAAGENSMGRRKIRKCRICKKSPVWRGGDVKNPGPYCKRCYHKHVWSDRSQAPRRALPDRTAEATETAPLAPPYDWPVIERVPRDSSVRKPIEGDPEWVDDEEIPF